MKAKSAGVARVAAVSFAVSLAMVAAKLAAGLASGSLALVSEAGNSALDAGLAAITFFAVSFAARPPDANHPYGHGKAENLAALTEAAALVVLALVVGREALERFMSPGVARLDPAWYAFAAAGGSVLVDLWRTRFLRKGASAHSSPALAAGGTNAAADVATSAGVLAGLAAARLGFPVADTIVAVVIAAYLTRSSIRLARTSVNALMDHAPEGATERVGSAASSVEGIDEVRRVRIRYSGGRAQADVVVGVSRKLPLERAHQITEEVEKAIAAIEPGADVVVHVEPLAGEKVLADTILSIAARHPGVHQVHNIFVARQPNGLLVSLHAKFPGTMSLADAHALAEHLEADIAAEIQGVARVDTHLEPLEAPVALGADVTENHSLLVESAREVAEAQPGVADCHEIVITDTPAGLSLVMHCEAEAGLAVSDVHESATRIETEVHRRWPEVERVTVHFEPRG